jgi:hypothetical protein
MLEEIVSDNDRKLEDWTARVGHEPKHLTTNQGRMSEHTDASRT